MFAELDLMIFDIMLHHISSFDFLNSLALKGVSLFSLYRFKSGGLKTTFKSGGLKTTFKSGACSPRPSLGLVSQVPACSPLSSLGPVPLSSRTNCTTEFEA